YAAGFFCFVSDEPMDAASREYLLRRRLALDAVRKDIVDISTSSQSGAVQPTLYLAGPGNVESHVVSSASGAEIKRTFVAFPEYTIDATPVVWNFRKDI